MKIGPYLPRPLKALQVVLLGRGQPITASQKVFGFGVLSVKFPNHSRDTGLGRIVDMAGFPVGQNFNEAAQEFLLNLWQPRHPRLKELFVDV